MLRSLARDAWTAAAREVKDAGAGVWEMMSSGEFIDPLGPGIDNDDFDTSEQAAAAEQAAAEQAAEQAAAEQAAAEQAAAEQAAAEQAAAEQAAAEQAAAEQAAAEQAAAEQAAAEQAAAEQAAAEQAAAEQAAAEQAAAEQAAAEQAAAEQAAEKLPIEEFLGFDDPDSIEPTQSAPQPSPSMMFALLQALKGPAIVVAAVAIGAAVGVGTFFAVSALATPVAGAFAGLAASAVTTSLVATSMYSLFGSSTKPSGIAQEPEFEDVAPATL